MKQILTLRTVLLIIAFALVAVACGTAEDTAETDSFREVETAAEEEVTEEAADFGFGDEEFAEEPEAVFEEVQEEPAEDALGRGGTGTDPLDAIQAGREIIFTADISVAVSDVAEAGAAATQAIQQHGGYLFGQQTTGGGEARSTLIFKVPPANFQDALTALGEIGEVRTQNVNADDVTHRVVDLESRITTAEASVDRLREFLLNAGDIKTIAELEAQLLDRETTLETLRGQLRTLQAAVSLSTITLHLSEALSNPQMEVQVTSYPGIEDAGRSCPGDFEGNSVLEGESLTVCYEIFNVGDTLLTGFTLRDGVLDIVFDDLTVVWGDPATNLEPGQSLVLATEVTLDRSLRTQTRITAIPVNEDGKRVEAREVASTTGIFLDARDPGGLPGFTEGLKASWEVLQNVGDLIVLTAGVLVPFLWLIAALFFYRRWRKQRKNAPKDVTEA